MTYYCSKCKKKHSGWPPFEFAYPEEYIRLSEKEKELKCFILNDGLKIEHGAHHHYYTHVYWSQKVQDSDTTWDFNIWVMIDNISMVEKMRKGEIDSCEAKLNSCFPWYLDFFLGYPIIIKYDKKKKILAIEELLIKTSTIYEDYMKGLPYEVAKRWSENLMEFCEFRCNS